MLVLFLLLLLPLRVFLWGYDGHAMVAAIASEFLDESIQENLKRVLNGETLTFYAPYPDDYDHCPGGTWSGPMHYMNCDTDRCHLDEKDCPDGYCVWNAMVNYTRRLNCTDKPCTIPPKHCSSSYNPEPCSLENIIHFTGDIHCPVHVVNSHVFPKGGSQMYVLVTFREGQKSENVTIHKVWDSVLITEILHRYFDSERDKYVESMVRDLKEDNDSLLKKYQEVGEDYDAYCEETIYESNVHAADYDTKTNVLDERYFLENHPVVTLTLMRAGARLAYILNKQFTC